MAKRLTIKDYQDANTKLVEDKKTLTVERDEARKERDDAKNMLVDDRNDILDLLGGRHHDFGGNSILSRKGATKVQIARRAGELVAAERLSERLGRMVFEDDIRIEGAPIDMKPFMGIDPGHPRGDRTVAHVHTKECLPPEMQESAKKLVDTIVSDIKEGVKRRRARRAFWSLVKLVAIIGIFVAVGYFGAAVIFG